MHDDAEWRLPGSVKDQQSVDSVWNRLRTPTIAGVSERDIRPVLTGYGRLLECYRTDWFPGEPPVAQVFCTVIRAGSISAWHAHAQTLDRIGIVAGSARLVLYDARRESPSYGCVDEFLLSEHRPTLIVVPPKVWHGVQCLGGGDAILSNAVDQAYEYADPDHYRLPFDSEQIPYRFPETRTR